jgi:hypothetical protein
MQIPVVPIVFPVITFSTALAEIQRPFRVGTVIGIVQTPPAPTNGAAMPPSSVRLPPDAAKLICVSPVHFVCVYEPESELKASEN